MEVLIAPDKFKGSLRAAEVAAHLAVGLRRADPSISTREVPIADGGEGTVEAAVAAGFRRVPVRASGPTGIWVDTGYAYRDGVAVVELADVSGLARLPGSRLDPLHASSYGAGQVIAAALDAGCHTVVLAVGGSACVDGGAGMLQALGVRLRDVDGVELRPGGAALTALHEVDVGGLHPGVAAAQLVLALDVDNPLLGERGAVAVYGRQKGVGPAEAPVLERGLGALARAIDPGAASRRGAGAAGGVGYGALAVLGARPRPGIDYVLELIGFADHLASAQLVITGEGSLDRQTLCGKGPAGIAAAAGRAGTPVIAVAGRTELTAEEADRAGFGSVRTLTELEPDPAVCIAEAGALLERLASDLATDLAARPGQPKGSQT